MAREWTSEAFSHAKRLWQAGKSGRQISEQLAEKLNFVASRSAVIGMMHREHIKTPVLPKSGRGRPQAPPAPVPKPRLVYRAPPAPDPIDEPAGPRLKLIDLTSDTCRFPYGETAPFLFCGAAVQGELSYCPFHCRVAYYRPKR